MAGADDAVEQILRPGEQPVDVGGEALDLLPREIPDQPLAQDGITQRQLDASAFEDSDDLAAFLRSVGFDMGVRSQVEETPSFSSIPALGLSPALVERMRPVLRLWVMTPRPHA